MKSHSGLRTIFISLPVMNTHASELVQKSRRIKNFVALVMGIDIPSFHLSVSRGCSFQITNQFYFIKGERNCSLCFMNSLLSNLGGKELMTYLTIFLLLVTTDPDRMGTGCRLLIYGL